MRRTRPTGVGSPPALGYPRPLSVRAEPEAGARRRAGRGYDEIVSTSSPAGFSNGRAVARARVGDVRRFIKDGFVAWVMRATRAFATTRRLFRRERVVTAKPPSGKPSSGRGYVHCSAS